MTSSTSTTRDPRIRSAASGSTAKAPVKLVKRSARPSVRCAGLSLRRSSRPLSDFSGAKCLANSKAWLKPRVIKRWRDRGIGSTMSALSRAGSTHGALRSSVAKLAAQPGWAPNMKPTISRAQGYSSASAATQASSGGGERTQAPHCVIGPSIGNAQVRQRSRGWAKRTTQSSHTGCAGQARQTAHWLGTLSDMLCSSARHIGPIYPWRHPNRLP